MSVPEPLTFADANNGTFSYTLNGVSQVKPLSRFVFAAPVLLVMLLSMMWLPVAIGVLISETFAIRSWLFHAGNGAVSAWIGWSLFGYIDDSRIPLNKPFPVIAAGLAGGLAYWAIAGWSAGFWKPVFRLGPATLPAKVASHPPEIR